MSREKSYKSEETLSCSSTQRKTERSKGSESLNNWDWDSCHSSDIGSNRSGRVRPSSWDDSDEEVQHKSQDTSPKKCRIYTSENVDVSKTSVRSEINEIRRQFFQNMENNFKEENAESLSYGVDRRQSPARVRRRTRSSSSSSPVLETKNQSTPEMEESSEEPETATPTIGSLELDPKLFLNNFFSDIRSKRISLMNETNQEGPICEETTTTEDKYFEEQDSFYCRTSRKLSQILEVEEMKKDNEEKINEDKQKEGYNNKRSAETPKATEAESPLSTARSKNSSGKAPEEYQQVKTDPVTFTIPKSLSLEKLEILKDSTKHPTGSLSERYNIFKYNEKEDIIFLTAKRGKTEIGLTKETGWLDWSCQFPSITNPVADVQEDCNLEITKNEEDIQEIFKINLDRNTPTPRISKENSYRSVGSSARSAKKTFELPEVPKLKINIDSSRSLQTEDITNLSGKEKEKEAVTGKKTPRTGNKKSSSESSSPSSRYENLQTKNSSSIKSRNSDRTVLHKNSTPSNSSGRSVSTAKSMNPNDSSRSQKHSSVRDIKTHGDPLSDKSVNNSLTSKTKVSTPDSAKSSKTNKSFKTTKNSIKVYSTPTELSYHSPKSLKVEGIALDCLSAEKKDTPVSQRSLQKTMEQENAISPTKTKADKSVEVNDDSLRLAKSFVDSETNTELPYPVSSRDVRRTRDNDQRKNPVLNKSLTSKNSKINSFRSEQSNPNSAEYTMTPKDLKNLENSNSSSFRANSLLDLRIETQSNPSSSDSSCRSALSSRVYNPESRQLSPPSSDSKYKKLSPRTFQMEIEKRLELLSRRLPKTPNTERPQRENLKSSSEKGKTNTTSKHEKPPPKTSSKASCSSSSSEKFFKTQPVHFQEMPVERCSLKPNKLFDDKQKSPQTIINSSWNEKARNKDGLCTDLTFNSGIVKSVYEYKKTDSQPNSNRLINEWPYFQKDSMDTLTFTDLVREFENNREDRSVTIRSKSDSNDEIITYRKLSVIDEVSVENQEYNSERSSNKMCRSARSRKLRSESIERKSTPEGASWNDIIETFDGNDKFPFGSNNFPGFPPNGGKTVVSKADENFADDSFSISRKIMESEKKSPKKNLAEKEFKNFHLGPAKSSAVETSKDSNPSAQKYSQMFYVDVNKIKAFGMGEFGDVNCWNVDKNKIIESEQPKDHGDGSQTVHPWQEVSVTLESPKKPKETKAVPRQLWTELKEGFSNTARKNLDDFETYFSHNSLRVSKSEDCLVRETKLVDQSQSHNHQKPMNESPTGLTSTRKRNKLTPSIPKTILDDFSGDSESNNEEDTIEDYKIDKKLSVSMHSLEIHFREPKEKTTSLTNLRLDDMPTKNEECVQSSRSLENKSEGKSTVETRNKWLSVGNSNKSKKTKKSRRKPKKGFILLRENSYRDEQEFLRTKVPPLKLRNSNCFQNFYKRVVSVFCLTSDSSVATSK